jgi:hypothetical protein
LFNFFGQDYPIYKAIAFGIALWIFHVAVVPNLIFESRPILFRTELEALVDLIAHIVYGIVATTYLIRTSEIQT